MRAAIQELGQLGLSRKEISDQLNVSDKVVKTWITRDETSDHPRTAGHSKLDSNDQRSLTRLAQNQKYNTLDKLLPVVNTSLKKRGKQTISRSTLHRNTKGKVVKQHPVKETLTPSNKTKRERYCLVVRDTPCMYGDSCTISVSKLQKWQLRGKYPGVMVIKPVGRRSDYTVHLYGFVMDQPKAKSALVFVTTKTKQQMLASGIPKKQVEKAKAFSGVHTKEVWAAAAKLAADNGCANSCSIIIDNASQHTGRPGKRMLRAAGIHAQVAYLPAHSPDLNPIEHVWPELQRRAADKMGKKVIHSVTQLKRIIERAWAEITDEMVRACVAAVDAHKQLCLDRQGGGPVC